MSAFDSFAVKSVVLNAPLDEGMPGPEHFTIVESTLKLEDLKEGEVLVQTLAMSADPYLRGSIKSTGYNKGGNVMKGFISGKVLASKNDKWAVGELLGGSLQFSTYQIITAATFTQTAVWKLTGLIDENHISYGVGVLGMPGSTAYGGLLDVLRPRRGETIFISAASGAVGSLVGMMAKQLFNCRVIGSCGGPDKVALVKEQFGFDHAIDYKTISDVAGLVAAVREVAPEGIDMYFENVGGMHFQAAMELLRTGGRVAICGQISEYNNKQATQCFFNPMKMIYTAQRIEGFVCQPWLRGERGNFLEDMSGWLREGKVRAQETYFEGVEAWPEAFQSLFTGKNVGKVVVRV